MSESGTAGLFGGLFGPVRSASATGTGCRRCSTPRRRLLVRWSEPGSRTQVPEPQSPRPRERQVRRGRDRTASGADRQPGARSVRALSDGLPAGAREAVHPAPPVRTHRHRPDAARQASPRHRRRPRGGAEQAAVLTDAHAGTVMAGRRCSSRRCRSRSGWSRPGGSMS